MPDLYLCNSTGFLICTNRSRRRIRTRTVQRSVQQDKLPLTVSLTAGGQTERTNSSLCFSSIFIFFLINVLDPSYFLALVLIIAPSAQRCEEQSESLPGLTITGSFPSFPEAVW